MLLSYESHYYISCMLDNINETQIILSEFLTEQAQKYDYEDELQRQYKELPIEHDYPKLDTEQAIDEEQLEDNEDELIRFLHDKFVMGQDKCIDYNEIDNNPKYDDIITIQRDEEELYFDDEEEEINDPQKGTIYTGVLDF